MTSTSVYAYRTSLTRAQLPGTGTKSPLSKRKRTSHPKVRTGCLTCKTRRLKCDEARPTCQRCQKDEWDCEGYKDWKRPSKKPKPPHLIPKRATTQPMDGRVPSGVLLRHPTQTPFQTEDEHRYFLTFRDRTAMLLSEYFNSAVWNKLMLQLCHREAFIAHAIVAIGALDKTMESGLGTGLDGSPSSQRGSQWHHEFALQQYSKALSLMRNTAAMGYLNCILSCVLTTCFESFHGNQESALAQAQAGLSLMVEWQDKIKASRQEPDACSVAEQILDPEIEDDLGLILGRLDREVWSFGQDTRPIQQHKAMYEEGYLSLERMPRNFTSLKEARRYYDLFARQTVRWRVIHHAEIPSMVQMLPSRTFRKVAVGDPSTPPQFSADIMEATRHGMLYFKGKGKQ